MKGLRKCNAMNAVGSVRITKREGETSVDIKPSTKGL